MSKLSNLVGKMQIVEKKKIIFLVPILIVILAIVLGVVYHFTSGSALNLGMDFSGGYTINVNVGANLTEENTDEYKATVSKIVENYKDAEGNPYNIKISQILVAGTGDDTSLQIKFKSIVDDEDEMDKITDGLVKEISDVVTKSLPVVEKTGGKVTLTYSLPVSEAIKRDVESKITAIGGSAITYETVNEVDGIAPSPKKVTFDYSGSLSEDEISEATAINDAFAATVYSNGKVGATVSQDLLYNALTAVLVALVLMLGYIAIRFEFNSGIAAIVALLHDMLIMCSFMVIFRVELNNTFIAALITILGYSINNTIILFDRIRSNIKLNPLWETKDLTNTSIKQSFFRCLSTSITTLIMIGSVCVVCWIASISNPDLYQMVTFSLPIIVGLISGFYSALFVAPSVWVSLGGHTKKLKSEVKASKTKA